MYARTRLRYGQLGNLFGQCSADHSLDLCLLALAPGMDWKVGSLIPPLCYALSEIRILAGNCRASKIEVESSSTLTLYLVPIPNITAVSMWNNRDSDGIRCNAFARFGTWQQTRKTERQESLARSTRWMAQTDTKVASTARTDHAIPELYADTEDRRMQALLIPFPVGTTPGDPIRSL
jgi:hypothetical protein